MTMFEPKAWLVAALLSASTPALAQGQRGAPWHGHDKTEQRDQGSMRRGGHWVMRELDLSREQVAKMRDLREKHMPQMRDLRDSLRVRQRELAKLFAEGANEEKISAKNTQISELRKTLAAISATSMAEMSKILTPEQRAKFAARMGSWDVPDAMPSPVPGTSPAPVASPAPTALPRK